MLSELPYFTIPAGWLINYVIANNRARPKFLRKLRQLQTRSLEINKRANRAAIIIGP